MSNSNPDVVVLGGGLIGMSVAWRSAQRGLKVTVVDPDPQRGAWRTAAGMLAPITELHPTETALLQLNLDSAQRYPRFVADLSEQTGADPGYVECGTIDAAWDAADLSALRERHELAASLGLRSRLLTGTELRERVPALAAGLPGGLLAEFDHQVDPRRLHAALSAAARSRGVVTVAAAGRPRIASGRVTGVTLDDGGAIPSRYVVVAAGAWSEALGGGPVRPVKGQTVRLRAPREFSLSTVVRAEVKGSPIYIVPRPDGQLVVGASSEEAGFDAAPRAGAVYELLRDAQSVLPELSEAQFEEVSTGLRPGSVDNAPLIGAGEFDGLIVATGHYRNGVLLTPVTADSVAELIASGTVAPVVRPFAPDRVRGIGPARRRPPTAVAV